MTVMTTRQGRKRSKEWKYLPAIGIVTIVISGFIFYPELVDVFLSLSRSSVDKSNCSFGPRIQTKATELFKGLEKKFDLTDPLIISHAKLAHKYLEPWIQPKNSPSQVGGIRVDTLKYLSQLWMYMACCGHVRIINGTLYYRFGGFYTVWYRQLRFFQSLKLIQDAIKLYKLEDLTVEFLLNTCDAPLSFLSDHWEGRGGFPILSTVVTSDTMDIAIPDPLDLSPSYTPDLSKQSPWKEKTSKAVFRGATTNYDLTDGNWGANPRVRLHRLSEAYPMALDVRIHRWSHATPEVREEMEDDEIRLGGYMNFSIFNAFKYQVVVDGGGGSCRVCGVLRSNQLTIRQKTPAYQFYEPLLKDKVQMLLVDRTFSDLASTVEWAKAHDSQVQEMVSRANSFSDGFCTWGGRMAYWAVLLSKYKMAMGDSVAQVEIPTKICKSKPPIEAMKLPQPTMSCKNLDVKKLQHHPCIFFCGGKAMDPNTFIWLTDDTLKPVKRIGPGHEKFDKLYG